MLPPSFWQKFCKHPQAQWLLFGSALLGTALVVGVGHHYRIDQVRCSSWPALSTGLLSAPIYLLGLGLLTLGWLGLVQLLSSPATPARSTPSTLRLLGVGLLMQLLGLLTPPFLSDDPLAYAAIGRAMAVYHQGSYVPLGQSLPVGDPLRTLIQQYDGWLAVGSAYSPLFNWISAGLARLSGDSLRLQLQLFQVLGILCMLATALVTGEAARQWFLGGGHLARKSHPSMSAFAEAPIAEDAQQASWRIFRRALALVLFCPLTLLEGTVNAHNDSLLALSIALFCLCVVHRQPVLATAALLLGPLVKASGVLILGLYLLQLACARLKLRLPAGRGPLLVIGGLALILMTALITVGQDFLASYISTLTKLIGSPADPYPYCTRSIECLPRAVLHMVLHLPRASWLVGLFFRALAGAFLLYMATRAEHGLRFLTWVASFVFFYYLYLHGASHPWYVLSLLPLLPFASGRLLPAMLALPIANLAHYFLDFPYNCDLRPLTVGATELVQALIVVVPSTVLLLRRRK